MARDRDERGRARNARPRDAAGRPLPRGAAGVDRVPDDLVLAPDDAVTEAQRLLDDGLPFGAHEVLEGAWKAAEPDTRELWRALAQVAVGLTHAQRGNARGAVSLLRRGAGGIREWQEAATVPPPAGLDPDGLSRYADDLAARVEHGNPVEHSTRAEHGAGPTTAVPPERLRPRLRGRTPS